MTFYLKIIFYFPLDEYFYVPILMKSVVTNGQSINLSQGVSLGRFFLRSGKKSLEKKFNEPHIGW